MAIYNNWFAYRTLFSFFSRAMLLVYQGGTRGIQTLPSPLNPSKNPMAATRNKGWTLPVPLSSSHLRRRRWNGETGPNVGNNFCGKVSMHSVVYIQHYTIYIYTYSDYVKYIVLSYIIPYQIIIYDITLHYIIIYNMLLCYIIFYYIVLYHIILY